MEIETLIEDFLDIGSLDNIQKPMKRVCRYQPVDEDLDNDLTDIKEITELLKDFSHLVGSFIRDKPNALIKKRRLQLERLSIQAFELADKIED